MAIEESISAPSLPEINAKAFSCTDTLAEEVINGLKLAGACIVRQLYDEKTIAKMDEEVDPYLTEENNLTCKNVVAPSHQ